MARRLPSRIVDLVNRPWDKAVVHLQDIINSILDWLNDSWGGVQATKKEITTFIINNPDSTFDLEGTTGDNLAKLTVGGSIAPAFPLTSANEVTSEKHFFTVKGTLPASPSTFTEGVLVNITSAGTASTNNGPNAASVYLRSGHTGSAYSTAIYAQNDAAGTATNPFSQLANFGVFGTSDATTTGTNVGTHGLASGGNVSIGAEGIAITAKNSATNIGVAGFGRNAGATPIEIGGYFGLNTSNPTFTSAALVADNAATTNPIARFRNNGTDQVLIGDGVPNDNSQHFLEVVGTLPSSPSLNPQGVLVNVTGAGSTVVGIEAATILLQAGYTGAGYSEALNAQNFTAGTDTNLFLGGNAGVFAGATATTTGSNIGLQTDARGGNISAGVVGTAVTAKNSATNIGVAGFGRNTGTTPIEIGVYAGLNNTNPTFTSAALVADNAATTNPIARFRNNGTDQVLIGDGVPNDNSQHFLEVVGTLPSSPSGVVVEGEQHLFTSAGASTTASQGGSTTVLFAGYTGDRWTAAETVSNRTAGTGTNIFGSGTAGANWGIAADSIATTSGTNVGVRSIALGGDRSIGMASVSGTAKNGATNIGGLFLGRNTGTTPTQVGVYAGLNSGASAPTFESAALIADNSDQTSPILLARDNGTTVWTIQDGGHVYAKIGTKTLTESTDTAFVRISVAQGTSVAGCVKYDIQANDGTDYQSRSGTLQFNCVNKAGTETPALSTPSTATEAFSESTGASTLTNTFTTATGTDTFDIRANAVSSLSQTTLRINYTVEMWSNAVTTVTPQ